ncbi:nickel-dependent hydrogenase large subunit [Streptomyces luomodiensis]|uniref:Nickel-dependent hydrogenase large subunit n=1 Tax=Streptomyces luomodiensis TaxID=3026192 RepID=A0ABY9VAT1_9ACTN|nr:nickel-dependent hydrogenase large subunit [Streptomyces sp. SCA4-21]WNF00744.1 nickel-dependent hydrogenase large subunit [Streptomyces sp. SCA4-21]
MSHRGSRVLRLDALARVEGEAALHLAVRDGTVTEARLHIYEPPRFFEAFLVGRGHGEPPDITSRICGICPVAYQMTACQAIERTCGVTVDGPLAELRRLLYCGEWIESQSLHIHLLHAPDFLGHPSAVELARENRAVVERGLRIKQTGNAIMERLGGRAIHPINVRVGGFYHVPAPAELRPLAERLRRAHDDALETVRWVAGFDFPDATFDGPFLAMRDPGRYAIDSGTPAVMAARADANGATTVAALPVEEFEHHVVERQVPHSTALVSALDGRPHLTGSLARYAVSGQWLHPSARDAAREAGLGDPATGAVCRNPFRSIIVRAVEVTHAVAEALRIIDAYEPPPRPRVEVPPRRATGCAATEAPRGLLYHRYAMDADGTLTFARIVPPTAQNQTAIADDLRRQVQARLDGPGEPPDDAELTALCERAVRNHDPCISCSAHFLDLTVERG